MSQGYTWTPHRPTTIHSHKSVSGAKPGVRQPVEECDPESELPCSCPRRNFMDPPEMLLMPATESNRKALDEYRLLQSARTTGGQQNCPSRKEKKRQVPVQEAPLNEDPSVDGFQDPPRDVLVGVDERCVLAAEVGNEDLDRNHDVIEAPLEVEQHIPDPVQIVEEGSRPKRSPKPNKKYSP